MRGGPDYERYITVELQGTYIIMFFKKSAPESRTAAMKKKQISIDQQFSPPRTMTQKNKFFN